MRWLRAEDGSRIVNDVKQSLRCLSSSTCGYTTQQRMRCVACGKVGGSGPFALRPGSSTRGSLRGAQTSATRLRSGVVASHDALTRRSRQPSSLACALSGREDENGQSDRSSVSVNATGPDRPTARGRAQIPALSNKAVYDKAVVSIAHILPNSNLSYGFIYIRL